MTRVDAEKISKELKQQGKMKLWQDIMEACEIYGLKHYARADKNLKHSFYLQYIMSQITLQDQAKSKTEISTTKKRDTKKNMKANLF